MSTGANPWLPPAVIPDEGETTDVPQLTTVPPWQRPTADAKAGGIPPPIRRLGWWRCPNRRISDVAWWAVGTHGGAGTTRFVSAMEAGGYDLSQHWPVVPPGAQRKPLLLVARTDLHGLRSAQDAIREWWHGLTPPDFDFAGLVLMSDAPGRLPNLVRNLARSLAGTVPHIWHIPWIPEWRIGGQPSRLPRQLSAIRDHLEALPVAVSPQDTQTTPQTDARDASPSDRTLGRSSA